MLLIAIERWRAAALHVEPICLMICSHCTADSPIMSPAHLLYTQRRATTFHFICAHKKIKHVQMTVGSTSANQQHSYQTMRRRISDPCQLTCHIACQAVSVKRTLASRGDTAQHPHAHCRASGIFGEDEWMSADRNLISTICADTQRLSAHMCKHYNITC